MFATITLVEVECYKCHMTFAMTKEFQQEKLTHRNDPERRGFYCPAGHSQLYTGESETQRLQRHLDSERAEVARVQEIRRQQEKQLQVQRGLVTRIKNRVRHGVCSDCNRSFQNLRRHMETKHGGKKHV